MTFAAAFYLLLATPARGAGAPALTQLKAQAGRAPAQAAPALPPGREWKAPQQVAGERVDGILIVGSPDFIAATKKALALVERSRLRAEVFASIGRIEESPCSGMDVYARVPTYDVGDRTWRTDPLWYAGTIVHDSRHAQLYAAASRAMGGLEPPPWTWEEVEGERKALKYQVSFMREMKASPEAIRYLSGLEADPKYQDIGAAPRAPYDPLKKPSGGFACRSRYW